MRDEDIILPLRRDTPKLLRLHRSFERLAGWCSWRCPLAALLLAGAAHVLPTPPWGRAAGDTLAAAFVALLFGSSGSTVALGAVVVERPRRWFERVGPILGVLAGLGLAALGLVGAWAFLRSAL